jgi:hypothetical protein
MKRIVHRLVSRLFAPPHYKVYELTYLAINCLLLVIAINLQGILISLLWFLPGLVVWILLEYSLHRFVFHFKTRNLWLRKLVYSVHGVHHANPQDKNKFYVPLVPSLLITLLLFYCLGWVMGDSIYAFLAGILFMHQIYNQVHLWIHSGHATRSIYLQMMREHHLQHHTTHGKRYFGVTTKIADYFFKTH